MSGWFKSWHGAPSDPKWLTIARRAKARPGEVAAVVWSLLDYASQSANRGSIAGYDAEGMADFFGFEPEKVAAIIQALKDRFVLVEGRFAAWERRQPAMASASTSTDRVRAFRQRQAALAAASKDETQKFHETDEALHATDETHETPDIDIDKISVLASLEQSARTDALASAREKRRRIETDFEEFWQLYPHKVGKADAVKKFRSAREKVDQETIMEGARRYIASKPGDRAWCNPSTWLNQERWNDQPAVVVSSPRNPTSTDRPQSAAAILRNLANQKTGDFFNDRDHIHIEGELASGPSGRVPSTQS